MLRRSFKPDKCKMALKLAIPRIRLMKNKREALFNQFKRELAQLLESGKDQTARIRVEHVVREEKTIAAYDLLEIYCELIVARMPIIESQKNCPIDLKEAIASVIFASARCEEIPELKDVTKHLTPKYGKDFTSSALELRPSCGVGRLLVEKLSVKAPDAATKLKILTAIAEEHNIKWDPDSFGEKESKIYYEDLLNGPNTLSDANRFPAGPPTTQASTSHYEQRPPSVQVSDPNVQDPKHIAKAKNQGMEFRNSFYGNEGAFSSTRQQGNMEFKDAADAARAALESAEQARMAARAAAELSIRQYAMESNMPAQGMRDEEPRKYTGSVSQGEHLAGHPDNISRNSRNYEQTEQKGTGGAENGFTTFVRNDDDKSIHGSSKSTSASFNEKPSMNNQIPDPYSQRNSSVGKQMDHFGEASMERNSGNGMAFVNELHGIKNPQNVDHHDVRNCEQSSYSSPHSRSNTFVDDCNVASNLDWQKSEDYNFTVYQEARTGKQSSYSSSSSSSTFTNDLVSNLNHPKSGNDSFEDPFLINDKGSFQRSTNETTDAYDNASAVFDDYGSYNDEYNFDFEEEHKVHEYNMNFSPPFQRSPTHPCQCSHSWSIEHKVESPEKPISQSRIFSEHRSTPIFFESSTSSAVPSSGNDLPPSFDNYGPSSESEEEVDKFVGNKKPSIGGNEKDMDSHQTEYSNDSSLAESKELDFGILTGGLRNKCYKHPPHAEIPRGDGSTLKTAMPSEPTVVSAYGRDETSSSRNSTADEAPTEFQSQKSNSDHRESFQHSQLASQATSKLVPETETSSSDGTLKSSQEEQPSRTIPNIVSSSNVKSSKAQTSTGERSPHVHPKLPDFDTLTAHFNSLRQNRQ